MKIKKLNEIAKFQDYVVVIYEDNEIGAGHGLYIVDTKDFDPNKEEERIYLNAIQKAILNEDEYGYGGSNCDIMLHNILQGEYGDTNVIEIKLPCHVDKAVYIWCNG